MYVGAVQVQPRQEDCGGFSAGIDGSAEGARVQGDKCTAYDILRFHPSRSTVKSNGCMNPRIFF